MLHRNRDAHTTPDGPAAVGECVCDRRLSAHVVDDGGERVWILNRGLKVRPFSCILEVQRGAIRCKSANVGVFPPRRAGSHRGTCGWRAFSGATWYVKMAGWFRFFRLVWQCFEMLGRYLSV